jgi:hypothetical protein
LAPRQWSCLALSPLVDGDEADSADVEGVVLVIVELVLFSWVLVTSLQDLPCLLSDLWLGSQLQQSSGETAGGLEIL